MLCSSLTEISFFNRPKKARVQLDGILLFQCVIAYCVMAFVHYDCQNTVTMKIVNYL